MRSIRIALPILLAGLLRAQSAPAPDAAAPPKIGDVTITATLRSRIYVWDWFQPASGNNTYEYSGNLLRLGFSQNHSRWDWNAEFAVPFLLGLPAAATAPSPQQGALGLGANYVAANGGSQNSAMIFPKQLYLLLHGPAGNRHAIQIGRFEFLDGSEVAPKNATLAVLRRDRVNARLIGTFGFTDVGRSFDGLRYSYATPSNNFTFVGATPTRGVFQVDGWGWNRVGVGYASFTHQWGSGRHAADTRLFAIEYLDGRPVLKSDNRPLAARHLDLDNIRLETFGGHTLHAVETGGGTLDLLAWGAVQTGRWGLERQRAGALDLEGGFQPKILPKLKSWLRGGYYWGSGDDNPNDGTHATFFQLLPTPRPFARFPFFNMMNNEDAYGILILRPAASLTLSSEFHSLRLSASQDLWYSGGGVFQPWTFGFAGRSASGRRSLGNLYDTSAEYRANRKLTVTGYAGYTQGLAVMEEIYAPGKDGKFGYVEFLYRF